MCVEQTNGRVDGPKKKDTPVVIDHDYWTSTLGAHFPDGATITSCVASFFLEEPDRNRQNKPRIDIALSFSNGTTVRYHPKAALIWSTEPQPTDAMTKRFNLKAKLEARRSNLNA